MRTAARSLGIPTSALLCSNFRQCSLGGWILATEKNYNTARPYPEHTHCLQHATHACTPYLETPSKHRNDKEVCPAYIQPPEVLKLARRPCRSMSGLYLYSKKRSTPGEVRPTPRSNQRSARALKKQINPPQVLKETLRLCRSHNGLPQTQI